MRFRYWPSPDEKQTLSQYLTIYGFWIGMSLAVIAILVAFNIFRTLTVKLESEGPTVSNISVKIIWQKGYKTNEQIDESLQRLLMGKPYEQPIWDFEDAQSLYFPKTLDDFPNHPAVLPTAKEPVFRPYRISGVPPLPEGQRPREVRVPLPGDDNWEWNIDDEVLSYILAGEDKRWNEIAWYKVAIAMVGGYSKVLTRPGLPVTVHKAAINAFEGAEWNFEVKYKVWNSGKEPLRLAKIIFDDQRADVRPPQGIDPKGFTIQPGYDNAIEFMLVSKMGYSTLSSVKSGAETVQKSTKLEFGDSEFLLAPSLSPFILIAIAILGGAAAATINMYCYRPKRH